MKRVENYKCPTCGATKEVEYRIGQPVLGFPEKIVCGYRDCSDYAIPVKP